MAEWLTLPGLAFQTPETKAWEDGHTVGRHEGAADERAAIIDAFSKALDPYLPCGSRYGRTEAHHHSLVHAIVVLRFSIENGAHLKPEDPER